MTIELVPASLVHVGPIATRMRLADVVECRAAGMSPKVALRSALRSSSLCYTATVDGRPEAMFGLVVTSALGGEGSPWMLGTEAIYDHPRQMLRGARQILAVMVDSTPRLSNIVSAENVRAIRFLRRLGFTFQEGVTVLAGTEFKHFEMERR